MLEAGGVVDGLHASYAEQKLHCAAAAAAAAAMFRAGPDGLLFTRSFALRPRPPPPSVAAGAW